MPLMSGAEPYHHAGGSVGVLLCHGFTGTPQSLRPWAEHLAAAGLTVSLPRLPGHGTTWQEMARTRWEDWYAELDRAFDGLRVQCRQIFLMGLSLGACMALRLAEQRGEDVSGLVLVNPSLHSSNRLLRLAPVLRLFIPWVHGVADDVKKEGAHELAYDRVPVTAASSLPGIWALTRAELHKVGQPILVFRSTEDHVVGPESIEILRSGVSSADFTETPCPNSYHVAPLDNDAPMIFAGSLDFVRAHAPSPQGRD